MVYPSSYIALRLSYVTTRAHVVVSGLPIPNTLPTLAARHFLASIQILSQTRGAGGAYLARGQALEPPIAAFRAYQLLIGITLIGSQNIQRIHQTACLIFRTTRLKRRLALSVSRCVSISCES
jgi:hypothetical protein